MNKPLILMYHRIANEPVDYWGLAVSPSHFEEHLSVLRRTRYPLPLLEFVDRLADDNLQPNAVALTFDDGYVDNLTVGLPRLAATDVPATVFLITGFLDRAEPFWWDELASLILLARGAKKFQLEINGKLLAFDLGGGSIDDEDRILPSALKNPHNVLEAVYHPVRLLDEDERDATMSTLRSIFFGRDDRARLGRPMTSDEVRILVSDGIVTIGAHTVTHPTLPGLKAAACRFEVTESKHACEALVAAPVKAFTYPYGEFNAEALEAVKSAGFAFACSTRRAPATESDIFTLPRLYVPDVDGDAFERRLRWASGGA